MRRTFRKHLVTIWCDHLHQRQPLRSPATTGVREVVLLTSKPTELGVRRSLRPLPFIVISPETGSCAGLLYYFSWLLFSPLRLRSWLPRTRRPSRPFR